MTDDELESKIEDLRRLAHAQEMTVARRQASDDPPPTSDVIGLVNLTARIDTLERILEHRRSRAAARAPVGKNPPRRRRDAHGRFVPAS